jgi:acetyl esterase/lipase
MATTTTTRSLTALISLLLGPGLACAQTPDPTATHANLAYASTRPQDGNGHLLDLYLPASQSAPAPVVIWTGGSAWLADSGKSRAGAVAAQLGSAGFAVAGVSIRSSSQVKFPGQLHDIKAAIRWLRLHADEYRLDAKRIAIMGDSSGGWTAAIAAVTGDVPELEGAVGSGGASSAVQAAVAFFPPTDFLAMDAWAVRRCEAGVGVIEAGRKGGFCHDAADSPESRLIGCALQGCPEKVRRADPARYISRADPPMMILHGQSDPLVPHQQGEYLYQALNKACHDAIFISLPKAGHGPATEFLSNDALREAAVIRSTSSQGCVVKNPTPYVPTWSTVIEFLQRSLG